MLLTKEQLAEMIQWGTCSTHCKGGQHVARNCTYIIGELFDFNLIVKYDSRKGMIHNRNTVIDTLYDLYLKQEN